MKNKIFFSVLLILSGCGSNETVTEQHHEEPDQVELTAAQLKTAGILLGKIEMKNLSSTLQVNGVLDVPPQNLVTVSAMMGGFVKSTDLLQGSKVKKGEVIAMIQNPDFIQIQQDYLDNISKLNFSEIEYKRQEELSKENIAAKKTFQQVTSEYNSLKAIHNGLLEKLSILNISPSTLENGNITSTVPIYSPTNGYVTVMNANIGKYVNPHDIICEIVNTTHMHVELTVFEKDLSKLKIGQKIRFVLVNEENKERTAKIYLINKKIDADRTVRVHAHMDEEDPDLVPNTYLKAFIEITDHQTPALPDESIVSADGKYFIFIKTKEVEHSKDKKEGVEKQEEEYAFKAIEIKTGVSQNGYTEVILPNGFDAEKSEVVIKGAYDLLAKRNNAEEDGEDGH